MPGPLLVLTAQMNCPHLPGKVTPVTTDVRVKAMGSPVLTAADQFPIVGCALSASTPPNPCVSVQWAAPSLRVKVQGTPALLQTSGGTCLSGTGPAGPAVISVNQTRAVGT